MSEASYDIAGPMLTAEQRQAIVREAYKRGQRDVLELVEQLIAVAATVDAQAFRSRLPYWDHGRSYLSPSGSEPKPCLWRVPFDDERDLTDVFEVVTAGLEGWRGGAV